MMENDEEIPSISVEGDWIPDSYDLNLKIWLVTPDRYAFSFKLEDLANAPKLLSEVYKKKNEVLDPDKPIQVPVEFDQKTMEGVLWWMTNHTLEEESFPITLPDFNPSDVWINALWDEWEYDFFSDVDGYSTLKLIHAAKFFGLDRFHALANKRLWYLINEKFAEIDPVEELRLSFHLPKPEPDFSEPDPTRVIESRQSKSLDVSRLLVSPSWTRDQLARLDSESSNQIEISHMPAPKQYCPESGEAYQWLPIEGYHAKEEPKCDNNEEEDSDDVSDLDDETVLDEEEFDDSLDSFMD